MNEFTDNYITTLLLPFLSLATFPTFPTFRRFLLALPSFRSAGIGSASIPRVSTSFSSAYREDIKKKVDEER